MAIKLQDLTSELKLDSKGFTGGTKLALAGIGALLAGVGLVSAGIGIMVKKTFEWANEVDGLGDVMDGTNEQFAALAFVARKSGVGVEALTKASVLLGKGLLKTNGTLDVTGKKLKEYGINVKDANGQVKTQVELTEEIGKKYASLGTQQERLNFLTEIYGKSGASMIDFFDTLAAEGGLDKVIDKVKRFGLAIDPARYEQFNRNLEELKLIGLGLAVSFTEKAMPALEKFLGFISNPKEIDVAKIAEWADTTTAKLAKGLGDSINNWVSSGGPEELSENLISWIDGIGDEDRVKSKLEIAMGHLTKAIGNAVANIKWSEIWAATDTKLDEIFIKGDEDIKVALNEIDATFNEWVATDVKNWFGENWRSLFTTGGVMAGDAITSGWVSRAGEFLAKLATLKTDAQDKLTDIAKEFYNRGTGWANQAAQGFEAGKKTILGAVTAIKDAINLILKKIMTTFSINVVMGNVLGGASGSGGLGGGGGSSGGRDQPRRNATGGNVSAGTLYSVNELGKGEYFLPAMNGRIEPDRKQSNEPIRLHDDSIRQIVMGFEREMTKVVG